MLLKEIPLPSNHSTPLPSARTSLPTLMLRELGSLADKLLRDGLPDHDVQLNGLLAAQELDLLGHLEPETAVEFQIENVAAFEVADAVFEIGLKKFHSSIQKSPPPFFSFERYDKIRKEKKRKRLGMNTCLVVCSMMLFA